MDDGAWSLSAPILWGGIAYLMGGVLWGALIPKLYGVDIWTVGTRNPGAANVGRTIGRTPGLAVFLADVLTGAAAVFIPQFLPSPSLGIVAGAAGVIVGNMFSPYWGFRGGAGLAKGVGVAMGLNPLGFVLFAILGGFISLRLHNNGVAGGLLLAGTAVHALAFAKEPLAAALIVLTGTFLFGRVLLQAKRSPRSSLPEVAEAS